jgi:hypothetical protein
MRLSSRMTRLAVGVLALAVLATAWYITSWNSRRATPGLRSVLTNDAPMAAPGIPVSTNEALGVITKAEIMLRRPASRDRSASLAGLRTQLNALDSRAASLAVQQYLRSGTDAPTELEFRLAADGSLKESPTLRLFLLDYLGWRDPVAAATLAEEVLGVSTSPDEWAVSLRAYALGKPGPAASAFLQRKVGELLRNEQWRRTPSAGYLEAFDVVVYTRDLSLIPELAGLARNTETRALTHAAYLTLDRLVQAAPAETLRQLQAQPDLLEGREATRADFFARADVRDPQQRQILESYLLDTARSPAEWQQFAGN